MFRLGQGLFLFYMISIVIKTVSHLKPPNLGWPLKPFQRTGKNETKILTSLKIFFKKAWPMYCDLKNLHTILFHLPIL